MSWYVASTGNHQGLVVEEKTGRNVAVAYDKADAPLLAAAPELLEALSYPRYGDTAGLLDKAIELIDRLQADTAGVSFFTPHLKRAAENIRAALTKAKEGGK